MHDAKNAYQVPQPPPSLGFSIHCFPKILQPHHAKSHTLLVGAWLWSRTHIHFSFLFIRFLFISPLRSWCRVSLCHRHPPILRPRISTIELRIYLSVHPCLSFAVLASRAFLAASPHLHPTPPLRLFFHFFCVFPFLIAQSILLHFLFC
jgi:hypothetical protein